MQGARVAPWLAALGGLCASGCIARSIAEQGTGWWRIPTDHVALTTDLDRDDGVGAARTLERTYQALAAAMPACPDATLVEPVEVTIFAHASDYDELDPHGATTLTLGGRNGLVSAPPAIVLGSGSELRATTWVHALAHRFVGACHPEAAPWVHEGLAELFETIRVDDEGVRIGAPPPHALWGREPRQPVGSAVFSEPFDLFYASDAPPPQYGPRGSQQLLDTRGPSRRLRRFATAWALVHAFMLGPDPRRAQLDRYLTSNGAFGIRSSELDGMLVEWVLQERVPERTLPIAVPLPRTPVPSSYTPAEADLLWAVLLSRRGDAARDRVRAHLSLASEEPSTARRALLLSAALGVLEETRTAGSVVAELASSAPDDLDVLHARLWLELMRGTLSNEATVVLAEAATRHDLRGADHTLAAYLAARLHQSTRARQEAEAAVRASPSAATARDALAFVLAMDGRFVDALRAARAASQLRVHDAPDAESDRTPPRPPVSDLSRRIAAFSDPNAPVLGLDASGADPLVRLHGRTSPDVAAMSIDPRCPGRVGELPVTRFDVAPGTPPLVVRTEGPNDTVLLVVDGEGRVHCDDDSGGGRNAAVLVEWERGPLRVYVGSFREDERGAQYDLVVEHATGVLDPGAVPRPCGVDLPDGSVRVGMRVVLGRHAPWPAADAVVPDPIRDENWAAAMNAFVGLEARITALAGRDEAGCPGVRVDLDDETWFWRVRDLGTR